MRYGPTVTSYKYSCLDTDTTRPWWGISGTTVRPLSAQNWNGVSIMHELHLTLKDSEWRESRIVNLPLTWLVPKRNHIWLRNICYLAWSNGSGLRQHVNLELMDGLRNHSSKWDVAQYQPTYHCKDTQIWQSQLTLDNYVRPYSLATSFEILYALHCFWFSFQMPWNPWP